MESKLQSIFTSMSHGWNKTLNVLLPPCCVLCGTSTGSVCLCPACKADMPWIGPQCHQCGLPLPPDNGETCGKCLQRPLSFGRIVSPLSYEFPVDQLVRALKFHHQLAEGRVLSDLMCDFIIKQQVELPDMLIPVPLHPIRMFKRGFNQAYELATYAAHTLEVPLMGSGLRRKRNTQAQSGLDRKQRLQNIRGAFYWKGRQRPAPHVVLIDDVMTTGTTVSECCRVLKKAGARRVDVWVPSRAIPAAGHSGKLS